MCRARPLQGTGRGNTVWISPLWGHHVMGTPSAYKFFVKISAYRLNLSNPRSAKCGEQRSDFIRLRIESGRLDQCAKSRKLVKNILRTENK